MKLTPEELSRRIAEHVEPPPTETFDGVLLGDRVVVRHTHPTKRVYEYKPEVVTMVDMLVRQKELDGELFMARQTIAAIRTENERLRGACEATESFLAWCRKDCTYAPLMHRFRCYEAELKNALKGAQ